MKVNNKVGSPLTDAAASVKTSNTKDAKKSKISDMFSATDLGASSQVNLSDRAQDTKKAKEIARKGLNDIDDAKVAKYQALIDGGKYKVDAAKVADKMVDEHLSNELAARETDE